VNRNDTPPGDDSAEPGEDTAEPGDDSVNDPGNERDSEAWQKEVKALKAEVLTLTRQLSGLLAKAESPEVSRRIEALESKLDKAIADLAKLAAPATPTPSPGPKLKKLAPAAPTNGGRKTRSGVPWT
jgi:hypothetical protein